MNSTGNTLEIMQAARELLASMEREKHLLWRDELPLSLYDIVDPEKGAEYLGFSVHFMEELAGSDTKHTAAALDLFEKRIYVSRRFPPDQLRFAIAHELGHIVLGHNISGIHRDRPVRGYESQFSRPPREAEADCFASSFLMPPKLVTAAFEARFTRIPFVIDDITAYHLSPDDPEALLRAEVGSRARGAALASSRRWNGRRFYSLHEVFKVSVSAMAIRLEDLGLIDMT